MVQWWRICLFSGDMGSIPHWGTKTPHAVEQLSPCSTITGLTCSGALTPQLRPAAAADAARSRQLCPTLCDPIDSSPPGSTIPGILQARTLEWVAISFSNAWKWKVKVKSLSRVRLFATLWTQPTRLLHPWDFPGKSTGMGCHRLLLNKT